MTDSATFGTEFQVTRALAERFAPPEYAFFLQVRNGTGYTRKVRTADAMAMSLWPSRGLLLHGFEIKVSRSDWLREMKNPAKAEDLAGYCDRWWIVTGDPKIVEEGELPATWGLIVPSAGKLKVKREAPPLTPKPFDRHFFASLMRCAHEVRPDRQELQSEYKRGVEEGKRQGEISLGSYERLRASLREFEQASGVSIEHAWNRGEIGRAVRTVLDGKHLRAAEQLHTMRESLQRTLTSIDAELAALEVKT